MGVSILTFLALFFIILTPESFAKEPSVVWQGKLTNKSMVLEGATTSKNETLLASYTTKKDIKYYEIFKVNNKTSKVKNLSKLTGGELYFFDFKGKAYMVHREKRVLTIYDENFKAVHKKTWKSSLRFYDFPIRKSEVGDNLIAIGENVYNFGTKKSEPFFILLKLDSKGKLVEVPNSKLPGESYYFTRPDQPAIAQHTLTFTDTKFSLKLDTSTVPNISKGFRSSFSSLAVTKYKNHFYFFLRENKQGEGAERLLKMNSKGKVVDYLEIPNVVVNSPEPQFIGNQVILTSYAEEGSSYYLINLDDFSMKKIAKDSYESSHAVIKKDLYSLFVNGEYQYFNNQNKLLYTLPKGIFATKNGKYGISIEGNYAASTVYDIKTGEILATLKTGHIESFDDKLLAVEQKSGYKQVKLYKLK